ncbi:MAG: TIGR01244 family phosphatase, partial [Boseongicola sp.]|nr:TIGR01244 family phosphatase [Boseongicola sp.]
MEIKHLTDQIAVGEQIVASDLKELHEKGFRAVVCNRPDGEGGDQPTFQELATEAERLGLEMRYLPVVGGKVSDGDAAEFGAVMAQLPKPVFAYCRTGTRSTTLWSLSQAAERPLPEIVRTAKAAGYDMSGVVRRIANGGITPTDAPDGSYDLVIVGAGAGGVAVAASLKQRMPGLEIAIIDPAEAHYYQPGWTMVGGGVFDAEDTVRTMGSLIPKGVHWIKAAVAAFEPKNDVVILDGCRVVKYKRLIVTPGLKLDWARVEGLVETLGRNGVTSNYRYDLAPYTWKLVSEMRSGRALFTQPPMPIKCAGAPQKAMYLSADHWTRKGVIGDIDIQFHNAGGVLFGVKDYVPALEAYVQKYGIALNFSQNLVAIDGPSKTAVFDVTKPDQTVER